MSKRRTLRIANTWRDTPIAKVIQPIEDFVERSSSSGIVLLVATILALLCANIAAIAPSYFGFLDTHIGITIGAFELEESILHWINDGLMVVFFLLVGLEIKRELLVGELSNPRAALLPIAAALGGAIVPALLYAAFNWGKPGIDGWGVPMATDIAFALGCLALLGDRVPFSLKVFLTAVAIVDDLIAVIVIAVFYSSGINWAMLGLGLLLLVLLFIANTMGVRELFIYLGVGVVVWLAFLQSGVHATIAGVLLAITIPARCQINDKEFRERIQALLNAFHAHEKEPQTPTTNARQNTIIQEMEDTALAVLTPLQRLEHDLHTPVHFLIMPLFAFANAGVALSLDTFSSAEVAIALGIIVGLVIGKPLGLFSVAYVVVKQGWATLPAGVRWGHILGAGILAGLGFTMSLFIAALGFGEGSEYLSIAKIAILVASIIAGGAGMFFLSRTRFHP